MQLNINYLPYSVVGTNFAEILFKFNNTMSGVQLNDSEITCDDVAGTTVLYQSI